MNPILPMKNKIRTIQFSYGTVKNASLKVPNGPHSINDIVSLIRESYLDYAFRPECNSLMSDEVLTSSIGHDNFFAGALGGYESRLDEKTFQTVKKDALDDLGMAIAVARYRMPNAERSEIYLRASENEVLEESMREFLSRFSNEAQKLVEAATV